MWYTYHVCNYVQRGARIVGCLIWAVAISLGGPEAIGKMVRMVRGSSNQALCHFVRSLSWNSRGSFSK